MNDSFKSAESFDKELIEKEIDDVPYLKKEQDKGSGKFRIGRLLNLDAGVYALLFISNFSRIYLAKTLEQNQEIKNDDVD